MKTKPSLVTSYDQVLENVQRFNAGLSMEAELGSLLAFYRAWYYVPEEDAVAPSKFIGYQDMTATDYGRGLGLDGRETEPVLRRWFDPLDERTPEYAYVRAKVEALTASLGKGVSRAARFGAPNKWRLPPRDPIPELALTVNQRDESSAVVEVFVRAFGTLRPSEQAAVLRRIKQT